MRSVTPRDLEQQLRELARRGAIVSVTDGMGQDMISSAREARDSMPGALMHATSRDANSRPPGLFPAAQRRSAVEPPQASAVPPQAAVAAHHSSGTGRRREPRRASPQRPRPLRKAARPNRGERRSRPPAPAARDEPEPAPFTVQSARLHSGPPRPTPSQAPARSRAWPGMALVAVLTAGGFAGARWYAQHDHPRAARAPAGARPAPVELTATAPKAASAAAPTEDTEVAAGTPTTLATDLQPQPTITQPDRIPGFGRVLPFIDHSRGVSVGDSEGLLVIEYEASRGPSPSVRVGGRDLWSRPDHHGTARGAPRDRLEAGNTDQLPLRDDPTG